MKYIIFVFFLFVSTVCVNAQLVEDFNDGDIVNGVMWTGDTDDFIVENGVLRLNAPDAGESSIFAPLSIPDSFSLTLYINMNFDPSATNMLKINFISSGNIADYYQLRLGENGSEDDIEVWKITDIGDEFLASGLSGGISKSPKFNLKINRRLDGLWELYTDFSLTGAYSLETTFFDNSIDLTSLDLFNIDCIYTSSRKDQFYFDNIVLEEYEPDLEAPQIISAKANGDHEVILTFDEPISNDALNISNYQFVPSLNIGFVSFNNILKSELLISLNSTLNSVDEYSLNIINIEDLFGNISNDQMVTFRYYGSPNVGDVLISEILFDPESGGEDFIEIYNNSDSYFDLKDLVIRNDENGAEKFISNNLYMTPKSYVAISKNVDFLKVQYKTPNEAVLYQNDLPAFDNANGNPMILFEVNGEYVTLDSLGYDESQHFGLIDDTEGVSLERLSFQIPAADKNNWHSSSEANYWATPGYKNSNNFTSSNNISGFTIVKKVFNPFGSEDRLLKIEYDIENAGTVANILIFNSRGFQVKNLINNGLLGNSGVITWDGLNDEGSLVAIGPYLIIIETFDLEGNTNKYKYHCVVADYLK